MIAMYSELRGINDVPKATVLQKVDGREATMVVLRISTAESYHKAMSINNVTSDSSTYIYKYSSKLSTTAKRQTRVNNAPQNDQRQQPTTTTNDDNQHRHNDHQAAVASRQKITQNTGEQTQAKHSNGSADTKRCS